jgi:hypothetical protein
MDECHKVGYRLITIFEDEWLLKRNIVINRLKHILGSFNGTRIHARKCEVKEISSDVKNKFLNCFHIQGSDNSTIKLGAFFNDQLVSIMTFSKGNISKGSSPQEGIWELNRFCSNFDYHIPGIANKLLEHFKRKYEWSEIFSFCDLRWSVGNLYRQLGFSTNEKSILNYWYFNGNKNIERVHRFSLRKRPDEPKDIPEWVLRKQEGYDRIYDCGNLKFILKNQI